jgi:hypothetical protein
MLRGSIAMVKKQPVEASRTGTLSGGYPERTLLRWNRNRVPGSRGYQDFTLHLSKVGFTPSRKTNTI